MRVFGTVAALCAFSSGVGAKEAYRSGNKPVQVADSDFRVDPNSCDEHLHLVEAICSEGSRQEVAICAEDNDLANGVSCKELGQSYYAWCLSYQTEKLQIQDLCENSPDSGSDHEAVDTSISIYQRRYLRGSNEISRHDVKDAIKRMLAKKLPSDVYCHDPIKQVAQSQQLFDAPAALEFLKECEEAVRQAKKQCVRSAIDTFYECIKVPHSSLSSIAQQCLSEEVYTKLWICIDELVQDNLMSMEPRNQHEIDDDLARLDDDSVQETA